ncbi:MAG: hypothetical protein IKP98_03675 [Bacilli bacterium]|nr:hypothetical protein [Bacilli bacterium]
MAYSYMEAVRLLSKVIIDNLPLPEYCDVHDYDFMKIVEGYLRQRKIKRLDSKSDTELALQLLKNQEKKTRHVPEIKIFIHGKSAATFAKMNNVPASSLRHAIYIGNKNHPEKSNDELGDEYVRKYKLNQLQFLYYGLTLDELHSMTGILIRLKHVQEMYVDEYEGKDTRPFDEISNEIISRLINIKQKKLVMATNSSSSDEGEN